MGLDMYLKAERYISGSDWTGGKATLTPDYRKVLRLLKLNSKLAGVNVGFPNATISINIGYWRKANAIHSWFVRNVQDGKDECQLQYVTREQLMKLGAECAVVLSDTNGAAKVLLPPTSGFFFGSTEIDEWYIRDLKETVKIVNRALSPEFKGYDFYYRSSW